MFFSYLSILIVEPVFPYRIKHKKIVVNTYEPTPWLDGGF